jgi:hypothetical protein
MATLGGHGFGAKVALATAINNLDRCTGVINLEGGPLDHRYYESYQELRGYVSALSQLDPSKTDVATAQKAIAEHVHCKKWASIFRQNIEEKGGMLNWKCNLSQLHHNMSMREPDVACWHQHYGLWPGQALALFAAHSRWVHLSTNTLPFYYTIPRLEGQFPGNINIHADGWESPLNHWLHEGPDDEHVWRLSQQMWRWLKNYDGCNVLLADKTEAGWHYISDRGFDVECNTRQGEYTPEHVHHNYLHTDAYEQSRKARGVEGASAGQFLPKGQFSPESKW